MAPGLIQQRMAIDRQRLAAVAALVVGGIGAALSLVMVGLGNGQWTAWFQMVLWVSWIVAGGATLVKYRRRIREFEGEHGVGAGRQSSSQTDTN
jgi:hypothetical protein